MLEKLLSRASVDLSGYRLEGPAILVLSGLIIGVGMAIATLVWLYRDARCRGKSGFLAIAFILLTGWPLSFIWWFWLRPKAIVKRASA